MLSLNFYNKVQFLKEYLMKYKKCIYWVLSVDRTHFILKSNPLIKFPSKYNTEYNLIKIMNDLKYLDISQDAIDEFRQMWILMAASICCHNKAHYIYKKKNPSYKNGIYWELTTDMKFLVLKNNVNIKFSVVSSETNNLIISKCKLSKMKLDENVINEFRKMWKSIHTHNEYVKYKKYVKKRVDVKKRPISL